MNIFSCDSNLTSTNVRLSVSPSVTKQCIEIAYKQQSPVIHESHPWQSSKTAIQDSLIHDSHPSPHQSHFQLSNTAISIHNATLLCCHFWKIATVSSYKLLQMLVNYQNQGQFWNFLVLGIPKLSLKVRFDQDLPELIKVKDKV